MLPLPPLTDKILAYSEVPNFDYSEAVDWAVEMLVRGYDTPNLVILAGLLKPADSWEAPGYLRAAVRELGLRFDTGEAAVLRYARYLVAQLAAGRPFGRTFTELTNLYHSHGPEPLVQDFALLHWAWRDFRAGETHSWDWPDATPETIDQLIVARARQWLAENNGTPPLA